MEQAVKAGLRDWPSVTVFEENVTEGLSLLSRFRRQYLIVQYSLFIEKKLAFSLYHLFRSLQVFQYIAHIRSPLNVSFFRENPL